METNYKIRFLLLSKDIKKDLVESNINLENQIVRYDDYPSFFQRSRKKTNHISHRELFAKLKAGEKFSHLTFLDWPMVETKSELAQTLNYILSLQEMTSAEIIFAVKCKSLDQSLKWFYKILDFDPKVVSEDRDYLDFALDPEQVRLHLNAKVENELGFRPLTEVGNS